MKTEKIAQKVIKSEMSDIVRDSLYIYGKEVVEDRALMDLRDGLKPVQRRILYAMWNLGIYHNRPYKKSARIVGEVLGKYHPQLWGHIMVTWRDKRSTVAKTKLKHANCKVS